MRCLRDIKTLMVAGLALYPLLVAFGNITDYGSNYVFVQHVLSMDTTFPGNKLMYRAITSPALQHLGYALIIAGEAADGLVLAWGAIALFRARGGTPARIRRRQALGRPRWRSSAFSSGSSASSSSVGSGSPCGSPRPGTARRRLSASSPRSSWWCSS